MDLGSFLFMAVVFAFFAFVLVAKMVRIVPQQQAFVMERLGKYHRTLSAGLHITIPFMDVVRYRHTLKEVVLDIPEQVCITKDNVQVAIDGVIFYRILDASRASYGVSDYEQAVIQLAQTTLRSEIGKIDLDRTFEEREKINLAVVLALDHATDPWGVKVLRYEIRTIQPPKDILASMEKQMRAERDKRAQILDSEGERDSKINKAEGVKQETIKNSEAHRQRQINEAEGQAQAILAVSKATADGLEMIARSLESSGGQLAARLRVAEEYVKEFGKFARDANTIIVPANASDITSVLATAFSVFEQATGRSLNVEPSTKGTPPRDRA
jgi:regulator of protease activity HflC (stomatin/prohibitin superfamily)